MNFLYHVHYYEYCEWARTEWLRQMYGAYKEIEERGMAIVVVDAELHYHSPARYDDLLTITVTPKSWGRSRFTLAYSIARLDSPGVALFTGTTSHCFINGNGRPIPIPQDLREGVTKAYPQL